ncbi:MAG TPA: toll/interleukin-1 receptor domain-containing protein [Pyrinomonadaceae bacterium]|nr:toll/interleukin-1 receptor domain-containing protein [Pyrinomonadaceae bacterium]
MRDIFISWGLPDREVVVPLCDRLRELGLSIWAYQDDMAAGDPIQLKVMEAIDDARVAIVCLSDETAKRPWMTTEATLIAKAHRVTRTIKHIIPVRVGPFELANLPHDLKPLDLNVFDLTDDGSGGKLAKLVEDIHKKLGLRAPVVMPAALFAMTETESSGLLEEWRKLLEGGVAGAAAPGKRPKSVVWLWEMCRRAGMKDPPELFNSLKDRYGKTPADLKPFKSGIKIMPAINSAVADANRVRLNNGIPPIFLRWVSGHWMTDTPPGFADERAFRDWWLFRDSLLVVDSISTYHPVIGPVVADVPADRSTLLWLPPYSHHTATLEDSLRDSAWNIRKYGDEVSKMEADMKRHVSFDVSTGLALKVWLRRALFDVPDPKKKALDETVKSVEQQGYPMSGVELSQLIG